jgi:hypothetical protein
MDGRAFPTRARTYFDKEVTNVDAEPVVVLEMTLRNLLQGDQLDPVDFLARADVLGVLGHDVMITRYGPYFQLANYLRRYTQSPVVFALGVPGLNELFDPKYYVLHSLEASLTDLGNSSAVIYGFASIHRGIPCLVSCSRCTM